MADNAEINSLTPQELDVWAGVATLLERLPAALDAQLQRDSGLTNFEHGILFALYSAPDSSLRLSVLAGFASSTLSRLSRAISRLEAKGWVRREVDPADGRFTFGVLTDAGRDKVIESTPAHHALIRRLIFESISPAQAKALGVITRKVSATIGPDAGWRPHDMGAQQAE